MAGRPNQKWEERLVSEWLRATYPTSAYQIRARLGSLPANLNAEELDEGGQRLVHGAFASWVDAIVWLPDRTLLVEAKVISHVNGIAQLTKYKRLLPNSPFVSVPLDLPVEPVLLYVIEDPIVSTMAREQGITLIQFGVSWLEEWRQSRLHRQRRPPALQTLAPL